MTITFPLTLPTAPSIRRVRILPSSIVGVSVSPFTAQQQVQDYADAGWAYEVELPAMERAAAEQWIAFRLKLRGRLGTFLLGDPAAKTARGTVAGSPLVDGAHAAGAKILATKGWTAGATILAGDYLQLGTGLDQRLYKNLADATADGSGEASLDIFPRLRAALVGDEAITTSDCRGLCRMVDNTMPWEVDEMRHYGLSFGAVEAL